MSKKNKKVIRIETKKGEFTTVRYSILHDKRLSGNALRILISLLSDADDFNATYALFMNRFGINKSTVRNAFKLLEELGYVRLDEQKRGHFYTVSEYGNLNTSKEKVEVAPEEKQIPIDDELNDKIKKNEELYKKYVASIEPFLDFGDIYDELLKLSDLHTNNGLIDFYVLKSKIQKLIDKKKTEQYKLLISIRDKRTKVITNRGVRLYESWLKEEIYDIGNLPTEIECKKKWGHIKMRNQKFTTDYETTQFDNAEEEYYDNQ